MSVGEAKNDEVEKKRLSQEERRERRGQMAQAIANGASMVEVCKQFKASPTYIKMACKEFGVSLAVSDRVEALGPNTLSIIAYLLNGTDPIREVAECFDVSRQRISDIKQRAEAAGIRFPRRRHKG
jgi:hypothetical protein